MTNEELLDNILGFQAYDCGCVDSGIRNDVLKEQCKGLVDERRRDLTGLFTAHVHALTSPDSGGYTIEDAEDFIKYLADEFNWG